jgi:hypothetical protein
MLTLRQLTTHDLDDLRAIANDRPEVFNGYSDEQYKKSLSEHIGESMLSNPLFFNLGIFRGDELIGAGFAKEMTSQPAWVWGYWVMKKGGFGNLMERSENITDLFKVMEELDRVIFEEMEDRRKLNRFYIAYPYETKDANGLRTVGFGDRLISFLTRTSPRKRRINNYKFFTDCVIEPDTVPKYPYQQQLLADRTYPIKLGIRMACLDSDQSGIASGS